MDDIGVVIGVIGAAAGICGVVFGCAGWKRQYKKEVFEEGGQQSAMQSDISYIKRRSDDTYIEIKEIKKSQDDLSRRVTRVETEVEGIQKRLK